MHPVIHTYWGNVDSYPLMCLIGAAAALCISLRLSRIFQLRVSKIFLLYLSGICSGIIGAATTYALVTYSAEELMSAIRTGSLRLGLVFYGGLITGSAFTYLIARLLRLDTKAYTRAIIPAVPAGHAFGRIGCFLSGCCYGKPSMIMPVQLLEAVCLVLIACALVYIAVRRKTNIVIAYLLLYCPVRFALEFMRGDSSRGFFLFFSTSQWISLALLTGAALYILKRKHR